MPDPGHLVRARNAQRNAIRMMNEGDTRQAEFYAQLAVSASLDALTEMMGKRAASATPPPSVPLMRSQAVILTHSESGIRHSGIRTWQSPVDEPPVIRVPALGMNRAQDVWERLGWSIEALSTDAIVGTFGHVWPCSLFYTGNWSMTGSGLARPSRGVVCTCDTPTG